MIHRTSKILNVEWIIVVDMWYNGNHPKNSFYEWSPPSHTLLGSDTTSGRIYGIYSDIYSGIYSDIYSGILSGIYSGIHFGILSGIYFDIFSDMGTAGPQPRAPDLIGQRPLRSGARSWGPAVALTPATRSWARGEERGGGERGRKEGRKDGWMDGRKEEATPIKSRDPQEL